MANQIKKLAGETAIYGMSTILARIVNFFFVPIYTRVLTTVEYGNYSEIMSYVAVLQVALVLGLETGCFKFANHNEHPDRPFSTALVTVFTVSVFFFMLLALFSSRISGAMGYPGYSKMIVYIGGILALDSITAIFFAKLRYELKALKFAVFKTVKILCETGFNLLLFFVVPGYFLAHPNSLLGEFIPTSVDFSYIIFAVFLSCVVCFILFIPDMFKIKLHFDGKLWKKMMLYSLPLMVAGLPGVINESLDRLLFRFFAGANWRSDLGIYQAAVKLAVIMNLFIQMFRYAAEPFFFARDKDKGSKELYARVMEYFVAFCMFIFLGVVLYMDILGLILGKNFRGALGTVPVMLLAYMLLGMLFNVSMWYKLSGQTKYAVTITLLGLAITAIVNIIFMPRFSYWASVAAHFTSCFVMLIYSARLGAKYYPIPYKWGRIISYVIAGLLLYVVAQAIAFGLKETGLSRMPMEFVKISANTVLLFVYLAYVQHKTKLLKYKWAQF